MAANRTNRSSASKEQQIQARENKQNSNTIDPASAGYDKKLDGPNRPSE